MAATRVLRKLHAQRPGGRLCRGLQHLHVLSGARPHAVKSTQPATEVGPSPLLPLAFGEHWGTACHFSGPWSTPRHKWGLICTWWGVKVTGELRGPVPSSWPGTLALGSTDPPCRGLPRPCGPVGTWLTHLRGISQQPGVGEPQISAEGHNVCETGKASRKLTTPQAQKMQWTHLCPLGKLKFLSKGQGRE